MTAKDHELIGSLIKDVARELGVCPVQSMLRSNVPPLPLARQTVAYILLLHGITTTNVGRLLGRDHSTIVSQRKALQDRLDTNDAMAPVIRDLIRKWEPVNAEDAIAPPGREIYITVNA